MMKLKLSLFLRNQQKYFSGISLLGLGSVLDNPIRLMYEVCREGEPGLLGGRGGLRRPGGGRDGGGRGGVLPVDPSPHLSDRHVEEGVLVSSGHLAGQCRPGPLHSSGV